MELVRKQTYITPTQDRAVKRLAQQQGTTEAEILRKALDQFLAKEGNSTNHFIMQSLTPDLYCFLLDDAIWNGTNISRGKRMFAASNFGMNSGRKPPGRKMPFTFPVFASTPVSW